jgi:thioredoxin 1
MLVKIIFRKKKSDTNQKNNLTIDWPDHVINLDENNFEEFIKKYPLSVIDFWAPWCAPCKAMAPRLRRLSNIYKGKLAFGKINTQDNSKIAKKFNISSIPHLGFFRYGKKISSSTGLKSVGDIKDIINELIKKS